MKKTVTLVILSLVLMIALSFVGCNTSEKNGEADTTDTENEQTTKYEDTTPEESAEESASDESASEKSEEETTYERLDYFGEDMSKYITVEKSDYEKIPVNISKEYLVDDAAVETYIDYMRLQYAETIEDQTDLTDVEIQFGDVVKFYFQGYVEDETFAGGSYLPEDFDEPKELVIGSQTYIPGFESSMIGLVPNQTSSDFENTVTIKATFPNDYDNKELKGKEAEFRLYIVSTSRQSIPAYDKEFITETMGYQPEREKYAAGELEDEFRREISDYLTSNYAQKIESGKADGIWEYLRNSVDIIQVPQIEIDFYYNSYYNSIASNFDYANSYYFTYYGYNIYESIDDFAIEYMGLEAGTDWKAKLKQQSYDLTLENLIYHAIAELEGIESVSDDEYKSKLDYWVNYYSSYGYTAEELEKNMGKTYIKESALYTKIMTFLDGRIEITYS